MANIKHRVGIVAPLEEVWTAITETARLAGWWASSASGGSQPGETLSLVFDGLTTLSFEVVERGERQLLHIKSVDGPGPWEDSHLEFHLEADEAQTFVVLKHYSEHATDDDFQFFMTKWPIFLVSLKAFVETGKGSPFPNDVKIQADL